MCGAKENPLLGPLIGSFPIQYEITVSLLIVGRMVQLTEAGEVLTRALPFFLDFVLYVIVVFGLIFPDQGSYL